MAASGAKSGFGTTLSIGSAITELGDIDGPDMKRNPIDVTHMASDNAAREFIGGLFDGGEVSVTVNFIKTVQATLLTQMSSATIQSCSMVLPSSLGTLTFSGLVTGLKPKSAIDDRVVADLTVKVSGLVVLT